MNRTGAHIKAVLPRPAKGTTLRRPVLLMVRPLGLGLFQLPLLHPFEAADDMR